MHAFDDARSIYVGIDEAGYGPRVGPLCVAMAAFSAPDGAGPDWRTLRSAVCRTPRSRSDRRVQVDDSKKVLERGPDGVVNLQRMERSVLAFLSLLSDDWSCDADMLASLGATIAPTPWYAGGAIETPIDAPLPEVRICANTVRDALGRAGCALESLQCRTVYEPELNAGWERTGSKARVSFEVVGSYLRWAWENIPENGRGHVCVDRQGGRTRYALLLRELFEDAEITVVERTKLVCRYRIADGARSMGVEFRVRAEEANLPTALASMTAKYAREVAMARFNRYWSARAPGLRPTAGYGQDAGRWLSQVEPLLSESERRLLVRQA